MNGRPWSGAHPPGPSKGQQKTALARAAAGWGQSAAWHFAEVQRKDAAGFLTALDLRHHIDHAARHARYAWHEAGRRLKMDAAG